MPSKRCHIITSYPCQAICQRPCRSCNFKPQASSNSSAIPDVKFSRPLLLHACIPQISFGVPQNQKSQSNQHIHLKSAKSNWKKAEVIHFHPILCMPAPSIIRSQRESKYESIVQEAEEKVEMSGDKWEKRNRLITNFWVAKPKKLATRRCFYEIRVIESKSKTKPLMCKEKETNYSASKECLSLNPKHLTGFPSSSHAILFRKTNEILNSLMQRRYEVKKIVRSRQTPWQAQRNSRSWWVCPYA